MRDALSTAPLLLRAPETRAPRRLPVGVGLLVGAAISLGLWMGLFELASRLWR